MTHGIENLGDITVDEVFELLDAHRVFITGARQVITNIHTREQCDGEPCVIHNPSDHVMRSFPTLWRPKEGPFEIGAPLMERTCPHGVGHPDPDHIASIVKIHGEDTARGDRVHGCDGCCR